MKFLICGIGSAGQRHYCNLKTLGCDDISVYHTGLGQALFTKAFLEANRPRIFRDLQRALEKKPDAVFVTNPTALHIPVALEAARAGCHLFIEKPLSHDLDGVSELEEIVRKNELAVQIGYHFRFHPVLLEAKRWLGSGSIGKPVSAHVSMGERVSDWHPWEDYRRSYACRSDLGGGVILTQSHDLDYLCWLFGPVEKDGIAAFGGRLGNLDIDVEDVAHIILRFQSGLIASASLDYFQQPPTRNLEIAGTKGKIIACLSEPSFGMLYTNDESSPLVYQRREFSRNDIYISELKNFLECLQTGRKPDGGLEQGREVLEIALAARRGIR